MVRKQSNTITGINRRGLVVVMRAPVEIEGTPPQIAFAPCYLADGLEIGGTLCLSDEISPGICRHPSGRFCVIMPKRVTLATAAVVKAETEKAA